MAEGSAEESTSRDMEHKSHSEMWNFLVRLSRTAEVPIEESIRHNHTFDNKRPFAQCFLDPE